jgi:AraC-like DNA-binding protein
MTGTIVAPVSTFKAGVCRTMSRSNKSWGRVHADHVRRTGLAKEETFITSDQHLVLLNLKGNSERGEYFLDGKPASFIQRRPGSVLFIPAGCNWKGWEIGASSAAYLSISIDPNLVTELLARGTSYKQHALDPDLGCEDPVLMNAARGIGSEIQDQNPLSTLLVESYVATLFAQLLRKQRYVPAARKTGGLAPKILNRVVEKIDDELTDELSLSQLSELAGLSIPHFCRAFKKTVGCPPYSFIVRRRIDRAKEFLRHSTMSVTDIALACGFSSSSHFANTFRREAGMPPLAYRTILDGDRTRHFS